MIVSMMLALPAVVKQNISNEAPLRRGHRLVFESKWIVYA